MKTSVEHFERLLADQHARSPESRLVWIRGFRSALDVSGCLQTDLRRRVAQAEEQALDDAVAVLAGTADYPKATEGPVRQIAGQQS